MIGVPFVALYATMNGLKTVHNPRATILKEFFVNGEFDLSNFEAEPLQKLNGNMAEKLLNFMKQPQRVTAYLLFHDHAQKLKSMSLLSCLFDY